MINKQFQHNIKGIHLRLLEQAAMASAAVSSRLRYLDAAAMRFAITAPTVAAGLKTQSTRLADDVGILLAAPRQDVCGACGSALVPGVSCTKTIESQVKPSTKSARKVKSRIAKETSDTKPPKVMVYTCNRCNRRTRIPIGLPPKRKQIAVSKVEEKVEVNAVLSASSSVRASDDVEKPAVASDVAVVVNQPQALTKTKQRAKTNKQSGLQALLAKNKANASAAASPAFDLMDFMKTS
jgi:RNase P subunit RPR2